jgi:hypothetical protein
VEIMPSLKDVARRQVERVGRVVSEQGQPRPETDRAYFLALAELMRRRTGPGFADLSEAELRVSSQNGEDGVIAEILRRTGTSERPYFVEFGIEDGAEGNCVVLADVLGWDGLFIEGDPQGHGALAAKYRWAPVQTLCSFVTPENVEALFRDAGVPSEPDVLSIDVDGGDYWIWRALSTFRPRVVVIEYNAGLDPRRSFVVPADYAGWDRTSYFGASIGALRELAAGKGYRFVHTDLAGINAFFVRDDLPGDWPAEPRVRGTNYYLSSWSHQPDELDRSYIEPPPL